MHPYVHCSVIYSSQDAKQPKCPPLDEWIKKRWYMYTTEYCSAIKNTEVLSSATTWMDLEGIMLNEIMTSEREGHTI